MPNPGNLIMTLHASDPVRLDGLCPECWCPGLVAIKVHMLSVGGVSEVGTFTGCVDCSYRRKSKPAP